MAVTQASKPFDGLGNQYYWSDLTQVWMQMSNQGVCRIRDSLSNNIGAYANNGGMYIFVTTGFAMVQGYMYQLAKLIADTDLQLSIGNNTSGVTRFDRVILRLNTNQNQTGITAIIVQGAGGAPPNLVRSGGIYDISIAQVTVPNNATAIPAGNIIDERDNYSVCGWVGQDLNFLSSAGGADSILLNIQPQGINGKKTFNTETVLQYVSGGFGQARFVNGNYGCILRNDGSATYLLMTASGDSLGNFNALRPFNINNSSGIVTIGNGLVVSGGGLVVQANGLAQAANTVSTYVFVSASYGVPGYGYFVVVDASGGSRTITLPSAGSASAMTVTNVKKWDSSANTVVIAAQGGQTIDNSSTYTLYSQYDSVTLRNDGSLTWFIQ